jgi:hypothetical protein
MNELVTALNDDDENYESLFSLSTKKILKMNYEMLLQLHLDKTTTLRYLKSLKEYRYIDEIHDLKCGAFIKWIPLTDPTNIPLSFSGIICEIKIADDVVLIICKNFMHRYYTFNMAECLIFQKLSPQEKVILMALDELEKG